ncbi:hypothetical protein JCM11641_003975 [Rhodosporidiobolus odoratus]
MSLRPDQHLPIRHVLDDAFRYKRPQARAIQDRREIYETKLTLLSYQEFHGEAKRVYKMTGACMAAEHEETRLLVFDMLIDYPALKWGQSVTQRWSEVVETQLQTAQGDHVAAALAESTAQRAHHENTERWQYFRAHHTTGALVPLHTEEYTARLLGNAGALTFRFETRADNLRRLHDDIDSTSPELLCKEWGIDPASVYGYSIRAPEAEKNSKADGAREP